MSLRPSGLQNQQSLSIQGSEISMERLAVLAAKRAAAVAVAFSVAGAVVEAEAVAVQVVVIVVAELAAAAAAAGSVAAAAEAGNIALGLTCARPPNN